MKNKSFVVGSNAFFSKFSDFVPSDIDILTIVDNPIDFNIERQIRLYRPKPQCIFEWRRMSKDEFIKYSLKSDCGMIIGKFLVPEFVKEIEMTINDLKSLEPLINKLDEKHNYERLIYDYYIKNNDFILTEDQLNNVYTEYKKNKNK